MVKVIMSVNGEILSACHSVFGTLRFLYWKVPRPRPSWGAVRQQAKRLKIKEWLLHWKISVDDSFTYFFFPQAQTMAAAGWWVRALNDRKQSANLVSFLISGENPTVRMLWRDWFFFSRVWCREKANRRLGSSPLFFCSESNKTSEQNQKMFRKSMAAIAWKALATVVALIVQAVHSF